MDSKGGSMKPSSKSVTVEEFLAMSSKERKALPHSEYATLFTEVLVKGLNEHTAALPEPKSLLPAA
jgi:hypothetical protein